MVFIIDNKTFNDDELIIAFRVTAEDKKMTLGLIQAGTVNPAVCRDRS